MMQRERNRSRRAVVVLPNGFTLANLFFGIFAIVTAARGDAERAAIYVVLGGVADALDGRVARATGTGSRFGSELDSLVDAISFGLAPALMMYFSVLNRDGWDWIFVFLFTACAVIRLARFNVEQAGRAKKYFHGLPSPAAGMTLATYFWLRGTDLYQGTIMSELPWDVLLRYLMAILAFLMISNVSYPAVPTIGYRKPHEIAGSLVVAATVIGMLTVPKQFFFFALTAYVLYGVAKTAFFGLIGRRPAGDSPVIEDQGSVFYDTPETPPSGLAELDADEALSETRRRRRRHFRRDRNPRPNNEDTRE